MGRAACGDERNEKLPSGVGRETGPCHAQTVSAGSCIDDGTCRGSVHRERERLGRPGRHTVGGLDDEAENSGRGVGTDDEVGGAVVVIDERDAAG